MRTVAIIQKLNTELFWSENASQCSRSQKYRPTARWLMPGLLTFCIWCRTSMRPTDSLEILIRIIIVFNLDSTSNNTSACYVARPTSGGVCCVLHIPRSRMVSPNVNKPFRATNCAARLIRNLLTCAHVIFRSAAARNNIYVTPLFAVRFQCCLLYTSDAADE